MRKEAFQHHHLGFSQQESEGPLPGSSFLSCHQFLLHLHANAQKLLGLMLPALGACQDQDQHFLVKVLNSWESQIDSGKITLIAQGWILLVSFLQVNEQLRKNNEDSSKDSSWDL